MKERGAVILFLLLGLIAHVDIVFGQPYPSKSVRIVSAEVGGSSDNAARLIAQRLSDSWGQSVIIDNRPNPVSAAQVLLGASSDGYTILWRGSSFWVEPLFQKMPVDPLKDFAPITMVSNSPAVVVVQPAFPAKSIKDLIALAKSKPGELNFGTASTGSAGHLAAELLKSMAGINMVRVQYKGASQSLSATLSGEVQMSFASTGSAMPLVNSGKLRALAVTSAQPSATAPGVPTVASYGLPGYEVGSSIGVFTTLKTPKAVVNQLNRDILRVLVMPDIKEKLLNMGTDVVGNSPAQFAVALKAEVTRLGKVIKDAGIQLE